MTSVISNIKAGTASVLAVNAGSSSIKFALYGADGELARLISGKIERIALPGVVLIVHETGNKSKTEPIQVSRCVDTIVATRRSILD
jgi:acetate kinase